METDQLEAERASNTTTPGSCSHIIDQSAGSGQDVATAYIEGTEVTALCGYSWVPSRSPAGLPICGECRAVIESAGRSFQP